jgi:hypothetical protein
MEQTYILAGTQNYDVQNAAKAPQIYARIDDDGLCRLTCTDQYPEFQEWLAKGNEPLPPDEEQ